MRVLLLTEVFHPETIGGSGRYVRDLAAALVRLGHEPWVLTRNPGGRLPQYEVSEAVQIVRYVVPQRSGPWLPPVQLWSARRGATNLARRIRFDVVHAQQPLVAAAAHAVPDLARRPWVYTFQSAWHEEYLIKRGRMAPGESARPTWTARAMRELEGAVVRRAQQIIVLSSYSAGRVRELHAATAPITRIPGGVDLDHFRADVPRSEAREACGLPQAGTILFTTRNLVPRMGLENLIDAVARLRQRHDDLHLLIGGSGPLEASLRAHAERAGLARSIRFCGRIEESRLPLYFRAADLFVLPTAQLEGFGLVTVEALASGTPVVATPVGGSLDILGHWHPRSLARGSDPVALAETIEGFIADPGAWPSSEECRAHAQASYAWDRVARETERVYRSAIQARARRGARPATASHASTGAGASR